MHPPHGGVQLHLLNYGKELGIILGAKTPEKIFHGTFLLEIVKTEANLIENISAWESE